MSQSGSLTGRLFRIVTMIQGSKHWTPAAIAEQLGTSGRTVYRDLERLRDGGVPVDFHDGDDGPRGYRIPPGFFLPPLELSMDEACALALLAERVAGTEQLPLTRPAALAMQKLRSVLPAALREVLDEIMPRVTMHLAASEGDGIDDVWSIASRAIADGHALRCEYDSNGSRTRERVKCEPFRFDPYELYFGQRAWYVVGLHHRHGEVRTLKLSRFNRIEPSDQSYAIPDDFSLQQYLGQAWRMIRKPNDKRHHIRIHFDAKVAETVEETNWHATQKLHARHDDGAVTFDFEIDGLDEIAYWVLGYGPHCEVLHPPELREKVADMLNQAARRYKS